MNSILHAAARQQVAVEWAVESARGLAHSRTLSRVTERKELRQVLECASPLALFNA